MKTDSYLKKDVLTELSWDALVPEARIGVMVNDGVVTLTGHLDTYAEKVAARRAVERVAGVKAIAMELDVVPIDIHQRGDTEIAAAVENILAWHTSVPQDRDKATTEKEWGTLRGELDWNFQRRAVERMLRPFKETLLPVNLSNRIQDALTRQAVREAQRIDISMDGGVVTLRGHVHSCAVRNAAEGATWSTPGVSHVNNQLTIEA